MKKRQKVLISIMAIGMLFFTYNIILDAQTYYINTYNDRNLKNIVRQDYYDKNFNYLKSKIRLFQVDLAKYDAAKDVNVIVGPEDKGKFKVCSGHQCDFVPINERDYNENIHVSENGQVLIQFINGAASSALYNVENKKRVEVNGNINGNGVTDGHYLWFKTFEIGGNGTSLLKVDPETMEIVKTINLADTSISDVYCVGDKTYLIDPKNPFLYQYKDGEIILSDVENITYSPENDLELQINQVFKKDDITYFVYGSRDEYYITDMKQKVKIENEQVTFLNDAYYDNEQGVLKVFMNEYDPIKKELFLIKYEYNLDNLELQSKVAAPTKSHMGTISIKGK